MGIWDYISGTTDSLKRNASDLTAVKNRCPTSDSIKRIAPDVTSAKNLCSSAYGYGPGAITQIDKAVRSNLNHYLGDTEGRAKIVRFSSSIVKHTAHESLKTVPGYKIVARSIRDLNESDNHEVDVKAMQADLRKLKKEFSEYRKVHEPEVDVKALQADVVRLEKELRKRHEQVQLDKPSVDLKSPNTANIHSVANQKLMKELDLFS